MLNLKIKSSTNNEEKTDLKQHDIHLRDAELARRSLQEDQEKASRNPDGNFSFDLQKALSYPKLSVSIAYYKQNMYSLNLGFNDFHNDDVDIQVWEETIPSRGSQEVASCCIKHLKNVTTQKHVITYSDSCTG
jgi:hypothetical protein